MILNGAATKGARVNKGLALFWAIAYLTTLLLPRLDHYPGRQTERTRSEDTNSARSVTPSVHAIPAPAKFRLHYPKPKRDGHSTETPGIAGSQQIIQRMVEELDDQLSLPFDINISLEKCGEPDASYDPDTHQVTICEETINIYYYLFSGRIKNSARLDEAVAGAITELFLHEVGHALIDAYKLPVTGREEDAVDQLATLILLNGRERMALDSAQGFKLRANLDKGGPQFLWDEHSLDSQRYYDTLCLIYGHNSREYSYMVTNKTLPAERAGKCTDDYERIKNAWQSLLAPHAKQSLKFG
jgi:hypothetical protein